MEVAVEQGQESAIGVFYIIYLDIRMIDGHVRIGVEGDAVKTSGKSENTFLHLG